MCIICHKVNDIVGYNFDQKFVYCATVLHATILNSCKATIFYGRKLLFLCTTFLTLGSSNLGQRCVFPIVLYCSPKLFLPGTTQELLRCFPLSKHSQKTFSCKLFRMPVGTFWISTTVSKCRPLRRFWISGERRKSHGKRFGEEVGCSRTTINFFARNSLKASSCVKACHCGARIYMTGKMAALTKRFRCLRRSKNWEIKLLVDNPTRWDRFFVQYLLTSKKICRDVSAESRNSLIRKDSVTRFRHSERHLILVTESESFYGWQSVSQSWYRAHFMDVWPDIASFSRVWFWNLLSCLCGAPYLTRGRVCPS
jgi:hypothetical protein